MLQHMPVQDIASTRVSMSDLSRLGGLSILPGKATPTGKAFMRAGVGMDRQVAIEVFLTQEGFPTFRFGTNERTRRQRSVATRGCRVHTSLGPTWHALGQAVIVSGSLSFGTEFIDLIFTSSQDSMLLLFVSTLKILMISVVLRFLHFDN